MNEQQFLDKIQKLEAELASERRLRERTEKDLRDTVRGQLEPFVPPTPSEIAAMMNTGGPQIRDLVKSMAAELPR